MKFKYLAIAGLAAALPVAASAQTLELSLVIDGTGSISASDFDLQLEGYRTAFNDATIRNRINAASGGIWVEVVQFGSAQTNPDSADIRLEFAGLLNDNTSIDSFRSSLLGISQIGGNTPLFEAVVFAADSLGSNGINAGERIIDVSSDGLNDFDASSTTLADANAAIFNNNIDVVNTLAVGAFDPTELDNLSDSTGGTDFVAADFGTDFDDILLTKIEEEIITTGVPEPSTYGIFGALVLGSLIGYRRFKARA